VEISGKSQCAPLLHCSLVSVISLIVGSGTLVHWCGHNLLPNGIVFTSTRSSTNQAGSGTCIFVASILECEVGQGATCLEAKISHYLESDMHSQDATLTESRPNSGRDSRIALALQNAVLREHDDGAASCTARSGTAEPTANTPEANATMSDHGNDSSQNPSELLLQTFKVAQSMVELDNMELVCHILQCLFRAGVVTRSRWGNDANKVQDATKDDNNQEEEKNVSKYPNIDNTSKRTTQATRALTKEPCAYVFPINDAIQRGFRRLPPSLPIPVPSRSHVLMSPKQLKVRGLRRRRKTRKPITTTRGLPKGLLFLRLLTFVGEHELCALEATCIGIHEMLSSGPFVPLYNEIWGKLALVRFASLHDNFTLHERNRLALPRTKQQVCLLAKAQLTQSSMSSEQLVLGSSSLDNGYVIRIPAYIPAARSLFGTFAIHRSDSKAREVAGRSAIAVLTQALQPCAMLFPHVEVSRIDSDVKPSMRTSVGRVNLVDIDTNAIASRIALEQLHSAADPQQPVFVLHPSHTKRQA
jgi:hypothetical protein